MTTIRCVATTVAIAIASATVYGQSDSIPGETRSMPASSSLHADDHVPSLVTTTVEIREPLLQVDKNLTVTFHATASEVMSSAGTYGDFSRYVQTFPGVIGNNDSSNSMLVRGGNPIENLFIVDRFEVPNISHISLVGTTGGLTSMINTVAIDKITLQTGGYGASYSERLSSVMEIHSRGLDEGKRHSEANVGIAGAGGLLVAKVGANGVLLTSAYRGLLNLFTNDIGMNGVPIYANTLTKLTLPFGSRDQLNILSLSGMDSIDINPCPSDAAEVSTIATQYSGHRTTNGFEWQHLYSNTSFGRLSISDSEQYQRISQQDQMLDRSIRYHEGYDCSRVKPAKGTPVYAERTNDGITSTRYDVQTQFRTHLNLSAGVVGRMIRPDYQVAQPQGQVSSLTVDPTRTDAVSFSRNPILGEGGMYVEASLSAPAPITIHVGGRVQYFSFGAHMTVTPRASVAYRLSSHSSLHASFGEYAQMPAYINLLSFPANRGLTPIRATHIIGGMDLWRGRHESASVELYRKLYTDYPVSTEYPTLTMATMINEVDGQFIWLPLASRGKGTSQGIELFLNSNRNRLSLQGAAAYSRTVFSGLDRVARSSSFNFPLVLNASGVYRAGRGVEVAVRYQYSTGRSYTPFLIEAATQQNRPIYDLSKVNAVRAPFYSRLDVQVNKEFSINSSRMYVYAGAQNVTNRDNFLSLVWMPRASINTQVKTLNQMPLFPIAGLRFVF